MWSILGGKLYDLLWAFSHCPMDGPIMEAAHEIGPTFVELAQCGSHFYRTHIHPLTLLYVQSKEKVAEQGTGFFSSFSKVVPQISVLQK